MLGTGFHCCHLPQYRRPIKTVGQFQIGEYRVPFGQGAGLVHRHHPGILQQLQGLALAKQHAQLGTATSADHDRGRCGQAHGTGAGNDQHRYRIDQGEGQRRFRADHQPDQEGQQRRAHHRGHEPHGDFVHYRLDRQLGALGLFDQSDDLRQHRLPAHGGGAQGKGPGLVHGTADHRAALGFFHRYRLAGDHRLVHIAAAVEHFTVHRNPLAGSDLDQITGQHLGHRHIDQLTVPLHMGHSRLQADQTLDRLGSPPPGLGFQIATEQDQRDYHRRRFVIDVDRALGQQSRQEGGDHRIAIGRSGTHRHQRVHVGCQPQQCRNALLIETPPRQDQHQGGQDKLQIPAVLHADGAVHQLVHAGDHVRAHLDDEHRQGQHRSNQQVAPQGLAFALLARCIGFGTGTGLAQQTSGIPGSGHRIHQRLFTGHTLDAGPLGGQIHHHSGHSGHRLEHPLDPTDTGGAGHVLHRQLGGAGQHPVTGLLHRLHQRGTVQRSGSADIRPLGRQVDRHRLHPLDPGQGLFHPPDTGSTGHALDGEAQGGWFGIAGGKSHLAPVLLN